MSRDKRVFWGVRNQALDTSVGELLLYGRLGSDGPASWFFDEITPKAFKADLDALGPIRALTVYINSDGGDVFAGQSIYSMLRRLNVPVTTVVDGLAASAASLVAIAGDTVVMPANAMLMIHSPSATIDGNAAFLREWADRLDLVQVSMVEAYVQKTDLRPERITALLEAETWMTADQAVAQGFADEIEATRRIAASVNARGIWEVNGQRFDLHRFRNPPAALGQPIEAAHPMPIEEPVPMSPVLIAATTAPSDERTGCEPPWKAADQQLQGYLRTLQRSAELAGAR